MEGKLRAVLKLLSDERSQGTVDITAKVLKELKDKRPYSGLWTQILAFAAVFY